MKLNVHRDFECVLSVTDVLQLLIIVFGFLS